MKYPYGVHGAQFFCAFLWKNRKNCQLQKYPIGVYSNREQKIPHKGIQQKNRKPPDTGIGKSGGQTERRKFI
jgi:hypothetical protein